MYNKYKNVRCAVCTCKSIEITDQMNYMVVQHYTCLPVGIEIVPP